MNNVVTDLINDIVARQGKTYEQASRIVFWDGVTPWLWEKFWWIDNKGVLTTKAHEKTMRGKQGRVEDRQFARKNNISVNDVWHDKKWKPIFWK